ncbi:MAG TPA: hypothetical protein VH092_01805 [Urbifossiella sp.]|jgi:hypothetical protein|nr:hypothetical protein [Urbifossiella sp.]
MSEADWLGTTGPDPMLAFVGRAASGRKLRLLAAACCREVWDRIPDERSRRAVEVAEAYADGLADEAEAEAAAGPAWEVGDEVRESGGDDGPGGAADLADAAAFAVTADERVTRATDLATDPGDQGRWLTAVLLRDLFGNPFRPAAADPSWLSAEVVSLADSIYVGRRFDRLPRLGDALQEAGCDRADILAHCQSGGPHARGCWVLDMALGKE